MKSFCQDLSAVAMRAIKTDQFVDRDLVQCLMLLAVRDPGEFAKFLALAPPKQSYLEARPSRFDLSITGMWGAMRDVYTCPTGKLLKTTGKLVNDGETLLYRARVIDCRQCPLKERCCPNMPLRRIPRSIYQEARDVARTLAKTEAFEQSRHDRKRVEMLFAHHKRIFGLGRLRLRGPRGAQFEFTLAAIAQNLRRLAKFVVRPPPAAEACFA